MKRLAYDLIPAILAAVLLLVLVGALQSLPFGEVSLGGKVLRILAAGAFVVAWVLGRSSFARTERPVAEALRLLLIGGVAAQSVLSVLFLLDLELSRLIIVLELGTMVALLLLTAWRIPVPLQIASTAVVVAAAAVFSSPTADASRNSETDPAERYLSSSYHDLKIVSHRVGERMRTTGGAIHRLDESRLLLVDGNGGGTIFATNRDSFAEIHGVELHLPMNKDVYIASGGVRDHRFRVVDVFAVPRDGYVSLLVTHAHWNAADRCYTLRLSEAPWDTTSHIEAGAWTTRFESKPCIALPQYTIEHGGRMAALDDQHVVFSVGNHTLEESDHEMLIGGDYGRVFKLNHLTWEAQSFSAGHRNIQGLMVSDGEIWATEHGPFGGDELNLLREDLNYGWPLASYGTDYTGKTLKHGRVGNHSEFERPIYSWTPSIGISSLIKVESALFPTWRGDFLIGSLRGQGNGLSVYRVRVREGRVVANERIELGFPVRDLVELSDGRIAIWNGTETIAIIDSISRAISTCLGCHPTRKNVIGIGPTLYRIVGTNVAGRSDFEYSQSMRDFGGTWTEDRLNAFITDPVGVVPGTTMAHGGVPGERDRNSIIEYLRQTSE